MAIGTTNTSGLFDGLGSVRAGGMPGGIGGVLGAFGTQAIKALRANLDRKLHYDSLLGQSITFTAQIRGQAFVFELQMNDYWAWVDAGRGETEKKGKSTPTLRQKLGGVSGWIARKPIPLPTTYSYRRKLKDGTEKTYTYAYKDSSKANNALAFLIARGIHRHGFKGNHFYQDVVTEALLLKLRSDIQQAARKEVEVTIEDTVKGLKGR